MNHLFEKFEFNDPAGSFVTEVNGIELPKDYLTFMKEHDGGEGFVGEAYVVMYPFNELAEVNEDYAIQNAYANCFVFGSDGGGMLFVYNSELKKYYQLDPCNCDDDDSNRFTLSDTLDEFFEALQSDVKTMDEAENTQENRIETMMVQLLFKSKPQSPTFEQLKHALEKYLGDLGEVPYFESSNESSGEMFMIPLFNYMVGVDDSSNGMPVVATFLGSDSQTGIDVDEEKRYQFWDVKNGNEIIDECNYTILVNTMLGTGLGYKDQAEIILAQVGAALDCYPECIGIYVHQSGKLITPEIFEANKKYSLAERFINLFVNARFFNISDSDEMLVDTLGFYVFNEADVQVHFKDLDPNHVVNYVYNIAGYQFENDFLIDSGETIDSLDENGNIQIEPQWTVQYEKSIIKPNRVVLDINCGKFAGGNRG